LIKSSFHIDEHSLPPATSQEGRTRKEERRKVERRKEEKKRVERRKEERR